MPLYFTTEGIAFAAGADKRPSVFVRYDASTKALSLEELPASVVLGDLDGPWPFNPNEDLEGVVRNLVSDLAVLKEPTVESQSIDSRIQILNNEPNSLVTAGGIEAQFVRVLSDKRKKTDITKLPNMSSVLQQFSPCLYRYTMNKSTHAGIFAQDLLKDNITKHFVSQTCEGNLTVDFVSYLFCLVAGLKDEVVLLNQQIKELKK